MMWLSELSQENQLRVVLVAGLVLAPLVDWGMSENTYGSTR